MSATLEQFANYLLAHGEEGLSPVDKRLLERLAAAAPISRDSASDFHEQLTFGQRMADRVAAFGGSWTFIGIFFACLVAWVVLNAILLAHIGGAFDPYPYILLNLFLSMLAALQAPIIMMSQNRQAAHDRLDAALDYQVNLKAELEIARLHERLDELRAGDLHVLLEAILARVAAQSPCDPSSTKPFGDPT